MTKEKIKEITDKAKTPCLIGMVAFDKDVQQFTYKSFNGDKCACYRDYKAALEKYTVNVINETK